MSSESTFSALVSAPKMRPDEIVSTLDQLGQIATPSNALLTTLARRCRDSSSLFFPPQIIRALTGFSKISFSSPDLFTFAVSRKEDLLVEASPKRVVDLVSAWSDLHLPLFHPELFDEFLRPAIVRVIPQLKRGIPELLRAFAEQTGEGDRDTSTLILALLKQAELNHKSGEIEAEVWLKCLEAGSRFQLPDVREYVRDELVKHETRPNTASAVYHAIASQRVAASVRHPVFRSPDAFSVSRNIELAARLGGSDVFGDEKIIFDHLESALNDQQLQRSMLPFNLSSMARMGGDTATIELLLDQIMKAPSLTTLSAEKLLSLFRAAKIARADPMIGEKIDKLIAPIAQQLTVRQARLLWECSEGMGPVSALPPVFGFKSDWTTDIPTRVVGAYTVVDAEEGRGTMTVPHFRLFANEGVIRPEMKLRQTALRRSSGLEIDLVPL